MGDLRFSIAKIRKRCEESGVNCVRVKIGLLDDLWWFDNDGSIKFNHWTGVDSEVFKEEDEEFYTNSYIQKIVNDNFLDILSDIDRQGEIKKGNSIRGL